MTSTVDVPTQTGTDTVEPAEAGARREWAAEYDRILRIDPNDVVIDVNVRTDNAGTDPDTVRDMRARGVEQAVRGYRAEDGTIMITTGQRRVLNAREAGVTVPVWMQAPPVADERKATIDRIVAQVNENTLREGLTVGDEARAVRQLAAFDLTEVGIARKLSRPVARVRNLLGVGDSKLAAAAGKRHGLDLDQLAVIAEFESAGDLESAKELIQTALERPRNFGVLAEHKRRERLENENFQRCTEQLRVELTEAGVPILDESTSDYTGDARALVGLRPTPDAEPYSELTVADHAGCPGHAAWIVEEYDEEDTRVAVAHYGCTDFRAHGHALIGAPHGQVDYGVTGNAGPAQSDSSADAEGSGAEQEHLAQERARLEAKIERRWVIENNKLFDASRAERHKWLAAFAQRRKAPQGAQLFLALHKARGNHALRRAMERQHPLAHTLLNLPEPGYGTPSALPEKMAGANAAKATVYDVFLTLCALEQDLTRQSWRHPLGSESDYMRTLIEWGYDASDVERKVVDPERVEDVIAARLNGDTQPDDDPEPESAGEEPEAGAQD